jgi:hypothetical protein
MTEQHTPQGAHAGPHRSLSRPRHRRVSVCSPEYRTGGADTGTPAAAPDLAAAAGEPAMCSHRQGPPDHITDPGALAPSAQPVVTARRTGTASTAGVPP